MEHELLLFYLNILDIKVDPHPSENVPVHGVVIGKVRVITPGGVCKMDDNHKVQNGFEII